MGALCSACRLLVLHFVISPQYYYYYCYCWRAVVALRRIHFYILLYAPLLLLSLLSSCVDAALLHSLSYLAPPWPLQMHLVMSIRIGWGGDNHRRCKKTSTGVLIHILFIATQRAVAAGLQIKCFYGKPQSFLYILS